MSPPNDTDDGMPLINSLNIFNLGLLSPASDVPIVKDVNNINDNSKVNKVVEDLGDVC